MNQRKCSHLSSKKIKIGSLYSFCIPGTTEEISVRVLEKLNYEKLPYQDYLVEVVKCTISQLSRVRKYNYKFIAREQELKTIKKYVEKNIQIGKIYFCELPACPGKFEVEVLTKLQSEIPALYVVRLIRCHIRQRESLLKNYGRRFIVSEENLLSESFNFN